MKRIYILPLIIVVLFMVACSGGEITAEIDTPPIQPRTPTPVAYSRDIMPIEMAMLRNTTDIVIVQLVGERPFGVGSLEFEFIVLERIVGDAPERIFLYLDEGKQLFQSGFYFRQGVDYLLALAAEDNPYSTLHKDGYWLVDDVVFNLNDLSDTIEHVTNYFYPSATLDRINSNLTREGVIAVISDIPLAEHPVNSIPFIRSELMEGIILGSPYVLVVEIVAPRLLSHELVSTKWTFHDIFDALVVDVLEGGLISVGDLVEVIFHANTVNVGEQYIVATRISETGRHNFTSRNSLFPMSDLPQILAILNPPQSVTITAEGDGNRLLPGNTLQLSAAVHPSVARQDITWAVTGHQQATISEAGLLAVANTTPGGTVLTVTATATDTEVYATLDLTIIVPEDEDGLRWFAGGHHRSGANNEADDETDTTTEQEHRLQLIFTINETIFLLNGDHRTAVGAPFLEGARTMVPLRTIAESTGAGVEWCDDTQSAIIHLYRSELFVEGVHQPTLTIPISDPLPDGMGSVMLINARTFVPLRFIMEAMDADVEWLEETEQAIITWLATGLPAWH